MSVFRKSNGRVWNGIVTLAFLALAACSGGGDSGTLPDVGQDNPFETLPAESATTDTYGSWTLTAVIEESDCPEILDVDASTNFDITIDESGCTIDEDVGTGTTASCQAAGSEAMVYMETTASSDGCDTISAELYHVTFATDGSATGEFTLELGMTEGCGTGYSYCKFTGTLTAELEDTDAPEETETLPTISQFAISDGEITAGESVTLSWNVIDDDELADAIAITVDTGEALGLDDLDETGSVTLTPTQTTTYTLTVTVEGEVEASKNVTVIVNAAGEGDGGDTGGEGDGKEDDVELTGDAEITIQSVSQTTSAGGMLTVTADIVNNTDVESFEVDVILTKSEGLSVFNGSNNGSKISSIITCKTKDCETLDGQSATVGIGTTAEDVELTFAVPADMETGRYSVSVRLKAILSDGSVVIVDRQALWKRVRVQ